MDINRTWWKEAVVYQIYPQSFNDSDGDGVGDLQGIIERLDYLDDLGVDVVWLNPVYDSPHKDDGYDIRDYYAIREEYGSLEEWDALLDGLHERGIRLVMDLVVNHTSSEHEWFIDSRENPDGEYGDYYVWVDGTPDRPPNNWESAFGGPAWTYDETRGAWYLSLFHESQPDLNWENPAVREDIYEMIRWWLAKGIDGFRLDVINLISKPEGFPDGDPESGWVGIEQFANGPRLVEFLEEMNAATYADYDAMTVGEMPAITVEHAREYTGPDSPLDMVFGFEHVELDRGEGGWWDVTDIDLRELKAVFSGWQEGLAEVGWNSLYFGNHDQPRIVSRFGDEAYRYESATLLATLLLTLQGTPYVFQGEEIGMTNYPWTSMDEFEDAQTVGEVEAAIDRGDIDSLEEVLDTVRYRSRDNARTPMQWDDRENAGFTTGDPWLPVNPNYHEVNVEAERACERSIWTYYRDLIALRHGEDPLVYGEYDLLIPDHEQVWAYTRTLGEDTVLVVLNWSDESVPPDLPPSLAGATRLIGNYDRDEPAGTLRPYEAQVYRLAP
jgi:oligo-1,6-glucosidase